MTAGSWESQLKTVLKIVHLLPEVHIGDFRRWKTHAVYQQAFARLLRDLAASAQKPDASA
jgi:hypothetical protein